ncbi:hypothetical protein [Salmonella enterica]|nr:hypothetical protein [Salmonella enterica]
MAGWAVKSRRPVVPLKNVCWRFALEPVLRKGGE